MLFLKYFKNIFLYSYKKQCLRENNRQGMANGCVYQHKSSVCKFHQFTNHKRARTPIPWYFSLVAIGATHTSPVSLPRTTKAKILAQCIIAEFATRAGACADEGETIGPGQWWKASRSAADPTQSQQESLTDDGRRRSVRSAGKVGLPGGSIRVAVAAPEAAGDVREREGAGACANAATDVDEDARRRERQVRTATDAAVSSAPSDCSHPVPDSVSSTWSAGFETRFSPGSQSAAAPAPSSNVRTRTDISWS